ncbi:MAG TPA: DNA-directed RNA polymerase subunit omega [Candidatus Omnitrophota bacterium]|nr:DNA-directed RNA polymerase subunit omega [Candidatus Omnitrophota bacterium]
MEETIDSLLSKAKNKFLLSNAVAGRAKQISEGSLPYVDNFDPTNPIITAIREIANDKIKIRMVAPGSKKAQEVDVLAPAEEAPSALIRLAKDAKERKSAAPKKEKKKK